jgi:beta-galactosidase
MSFPRKTLSLNGDWDILPGGKDVPSEGWLAKVPVPGLVDLSSPEFDWRAYPYHWYRTPFVADKAVASGRTLIRIDQAMFGTEVWLNGSAVGSDISCYTSQEYDLTAMVRPGQENNLLIRVGSKETLPPESAVGSDRERGFFIPGIWGDVHLVHCMNQRIRHVQVVPHIGSATAEIRVTVENIDPESKRMRLAATVLEWKSGSLAGVSGSLDADISGQSNTTIVIHVLIRDLKMWSVDQPFLYESVVGISTDGVKVDEVRTRFGMREFTIEGGNFHLNGRRVFLKGGNIAFHRFLSDPDRHHLPWEPEWIRRVLVDVPKAHHFNFVRSHIGQMYNRWYDIADEHGMMIQNEWQFWTTTGSKEQIEKEFTRWLQDNWNHPSIVIWDALNESSDPVVEHEIIPAMKRLDPTRPWEPADFLEDHPYIYSLGPVLNEQRFGFSRGFRDLESSPTPRVINEFLWWWLDKTGTPTSMMRGILERWLGPSPSREEVVKHQSFLATELVEHFRRQRVDAIQPFVYLSNHDGPTANWFLGDIEDLTVKPVMQALRNAFTPFGVSIELWDRHFSPSERRTIRVFVFNDEYIDRIGSLEARILNGAGMLLFKRVVPVHVGPVSFEIVSVDFEFSGDPGPCEIRVDLIPAGFSDPIATSRKFGFLVADPQCPDALRQARIAVLAKESECALFLNQAGIAIEDLAPENEVLPDVVVVGEGEAMSDLYQSKIDSVSHMLELGKSVVILEPEFGINGKKDFPLADDVFLKAEWRPDSDKGGYDSFIFPGDPGHPMWKGLRPEHFRFFNGAVGGEIVSQHDVSLNKAWTVLARCGINLGVVALAEVKIRRGTVIISRIQTRGRLVSGDAKTDLFARRVDPVAGQYLLNMLEYARAMASTNNKMEWQQ